GCGATVPYLKAECVGTRFAAPHATLSKQWLFDSTHAAAKAFDIATARDCIRVSTIPDAPNGSSALLPLGFTQLGLALAEYAREGLSPRARYQRGVPMTKSSPST